MIRESVDKAIGQIRSNVKWFAENNPFLASWLDSYVPLKRKQVWNEKIEIIHHQIAFTNNSIDTIKNKSANNQLPFAGQLVAESLRSNREVVHRTKTNRVDKRQRLDIWGHNEHALHMR